MLHYFPIANLMLFWLSLVVRLCAYSVSFVSLWLKRRQSLVYDQWSRTTITEAEAQSTEDEQTEILLCLVA